MHPGHWYKCLPYARRYTSKQYWHILSSTSTTNPLNVIHHWTQKHEKKSHEQKPNMQLKRPARICFSETCQIPILPFLPRRKNRIPRCSVKHWPWHFDTLKSNFQPSVERAAIWLNYSPPKHGLHKPVKLPSLAFFFAFFFYSNGTKPPVSIWKVTVCRFSPWVHMVSGFMGWWGLLLGSEWSLSGGCYSSCSWGHGNGGHQMCYHVWAQTARSFQTSHYTMRVCGRPALCFISCYLSSTI